MAGQARLRIAAEVLEMPRRKREQWQVREAARKTILGNQPGKLVLGYLAERANADGYTHVHRETIVRETGVAMRTLQNMLRCLREVGLLSYRRVNQAERMERGVMHSEEFQVNVDRMGEDTSAAFAAAYSKVQRKKVAILPDPTKSVAEALSHPVAAAENTVGATEKSVAKTHPPHPLFGGITQERLSNTPAGERWITASEQAAFGMGVVPSRWPALLPVIREALEQHCRQTGSSAGDAAKRMVSARSRALEQGLRMGVDAWIADGHWLAPSLDKRESPATGSSAADTHEQARRMSLADFNRSRRAWKEPELTEAEYAKWV